MRWRCWGSCRPTSARRFAGGYSANVTTPSSRSELECSQSVARQRVSRGLRTLRARIEGAS